jgi:hypothetical protein
VEWLESESLIPPALWRLCFPSTLEGRWWYETLEQSGLEDQFRFLYGLVRRNNAPIGIVPAFSMNVPMELVAPPWIMPHVRAAGRVFPQILHEPTLFVGSPCSDEGTIGLLPGINLKQIAPFIHEAVEQKASKLGSRVVAWKDFPLETHAELLPVLERYGLFPSLSYPGTSVKLTGSSMKEYLERLKGSRRHNLKKKLARSKQDSNLVASVVQFPEPAVLDQVFALFWQTYLKGETKFEKLTPKFFHLIAQKKVSWFILLHDERDGRMVAFMLCFKLGNKVINKFIGIDYHRPKEWFLYFRLWEAAMEWALSQGATEFQSGQTGYRGKIDIGHQLVPLLNYCRNRNPLLHELYRRVGPTITWSDLDSDLLEFVKAHPEADFRLSPQLHQEGVVV